MENNEQYITDRIRNHREEIDLDDLWEGVSPHIPKEKKRRKIGFWFFGGLAIASLVIGISWMMSPKFDYEQDRLASIKNIEIDQNKTEQSSIEKLNTEDEIESSNNEEQILGIESKKTASDNVSRKLKNETIIKNQTKAIIKQKNKIENSKKVLTQSKPKSNFSQQKNNLIIIESAKTNSKPNQITEASNIHLLPVDNRITDIKQRLFFTSIDQLNHRYQILQFEKRPIFSDLEIDIKETKNPLVNVNRWSAHLFGGGGMLDRKLNLKSIELKSERDRRDKNLDLVGEWSIEGGIGFRITPRLKIMSGLNYTQIHEVERFESSYLIDTEIETENLIKKQDGSVLNEFENSTVQARRVTSEKRYNQIRLFQIPLRLTYDFLQVDKFNISIGGLASYSFNQKYEGHTSLSFSQESYDITLDKDNKFRTSGSMSYGLFLEGTTHLSKMIDLSLRIGYKQINNINSEIYLIDQKYNSLTFSTGVSRRF